MKAEIDAKPEQQQQYQQQQEYQYEQPYQQSYAEEDDNSGQVHTEAFPQVQHVVEQFESVIRQ